MSSTVMWLGTRSSRRAPICSLRSSSVLQESRISLSTLNRTRSRMPHSFFASKSTYLEMSTIPLETTRTSLSSSTFTVTEVTPASSIFSARARETVAPASAITSPVEGSATGRASTCPARRPARFSFLLYL